MVDALAIVTKEMEEAEGLVVRQARALQIANDDEYKEAGEFLNAVIAKGKEQVLVTFDPHVRRAHEAWNGLTTDRRNHLAPWEEAERIVKAERVRYFTEAEKKAEAERQAAQEQAESLERMRQALEAKAARALAAEEAERIRNDAARQRQAAEVARFRAIEEALATGCTHEPTCIGVVLHQAREAGDAAEVRRIEQERARQVQAEKDMAQHLEAQAAQVQAAGEESAKAIAEEPVQVFVPTPAGSRLGGVSGTWKCNREQWDPVAFAEWIAENPKARAHYIGAPAWGVLDAEAKAQKNLFRAGGITAAKVNSGRLGK